MPLPHLRQRVEALLSAHSDLKSFMLTFNPDLQLACAKNEERAYFGTAPTLVVMNHAYTGRNCIN